MQQYTNCILTKSDLCHNGRTGRHNIIYFNKVKQNSYIESEVFGYNRQSESIEKKNSLLLKLSLKTRSVFEKNCLELKISTIASVQNISTEQSISECQSNPNSSSSKHFHSNSKEGSDLKSCCVKVLLFVNSILIVYNSIAATKASFVLSTLLYDNILCQEAKYGPQA